MQRGARIVSGSQWDDQRHEEFDWRLPYRLQIELSIEVNSVLSDPFEHFSGQKVGEGAFPGFLCLCKDRHGIRI